MNKAMLLAAVVLTVVFMSGLAMAQENKLTIDLSKMDPDTAAQVIRAQQNIEKAEQGIPTPSEMEKYAEIGTKMGQAIGAASKELSIGVNEFIGTPAGLITVGVIGWKMIGIDLWHIIGGTLCWLVISSIIMWSFRYFHMSCKIKLDDKTVKYVRRYEFISDDARNTSATVHVVLFCLVTIVCMIIVF